MGCSAEVLPWGCGRTEARPGLCDLIRFQTRPPPPGCVSPSKGPGRPPGGLLAACAQGPRNLGPRRCSGNSCWGAETPALPNPQQLVHICPRELGSPGLPSAQGHLALPNGAPGTDSSSKEVCSSGEGLLTRQPAGISSEGRMSTPHHLGDCQIPVSLEHLWSGSGQWALCELWLSLRISVLAGSRAGPALQGCTTETWGHLLSPTVLATRAYGICGLSLTLRG